MGIEKLTDRELEVLHAKCQRAAVNSQRILKKAEAERKSRQSAKETSKPSSPVKPVRRRSAA